MQAGEPVVHFLQKDRAWARPLRMELRRRGARVGAAESTADLLRLAMGARPDVIVADGDAEAVPQATLTGLLHRQLPTARIILIHRRGASDPNLADQGVVHQFVQPVSLESLAGAIEGVLPGRLAAPAPRGPDSAPLILCVDDDPMYLDSLERLLTRNGYRVVTSDDPESALDAVPSLGLRLAILDVLMPGLNGLNLAEELIENSHGTVPVVLLTALGSDRDISEGYRKGVRYYLTKPCEPRTLLNVVDYLVGDLDPEERDLLAAELP